MYCTLNIMNVPLVNFIFCLIIMILGLSKAKKSQPALLIGLAFGLFMVSHLADAFGILRLTPGSLMSIRILGYLVIIWAMTKLAK